MSKFKIEYTKEQLEKLVLLLAPYSHNLYQSVDDTYSKTRSELLAIYTGACLVGGVDTHKYYYSSAYTDDQVREDIGDGPVLNTILKVRIMLNELEDEWTATLLACDQLGGIYVRKQSFERRDKVTVTA